MRMLICSLLECFNVTQLRKKTSVSINVLDISVVVLRACTSRSQPFGDPVSLLSDHFFYLFPTFQYVSIVQHRTLPTYDGLCDSSIGSRFLLMQLSNDLSLKTNLKRKRTVTKSEALQLRSPRIPSKLYSASSLRRGCGIPECESSQQSSQYCFVSTTKLFSLK